ncbi:hypothetical protein IQ265_16195 [Nodosilinea sp. LEGE 06152]|uniref:hypothetical protein n=1 Tax=Nodosilinea sp. LEGE 06152 TaxID=2777966 RepID=UPI001880EBE2|nr:hypothetical protein [Nodosilinea sp. LEGE 06152]MBE9158358.1 hypothetical protein [Nodosilinea sp. LEGE 06152]
MLNDTESSPAFWSAVQDVAIQVLQVIDIRVALVIGLAAFMLAVGFDSSGNQAEAADLVTQSALVPVKVSARATSLSDSFLEPSATVGNTQLAATRRLHHGNLTSAILTNNRLTEAHFFTDLPAGE